MIEVLVLGPIELRHDGVASACAGGSAATAARASDAFPASPATT